MLMKVFCIYDAKVGSYGKPFFLRSKGEAIRAFTEAAHDSKTQISAYPSDFTLFELGDYDDCKAHFTFYTAPVPLGIAQEFVRDVTV